MPCRAELTPVQTIFFLGAAQATRLGETQRGQVASTRLLRRQLLTEWGHLGNCEHSAAQQRRSALDLDRLGPGPAGSGLCHIAACFSNQLFVCVQNPRPKPPLPADHSYARGHFEALVAVQCASVQSNLV